ncbi:hypothetical protein D9758_004533 [Tetrapyrgos nigripes]|uniref:Uncharacterized protein n=1 Tax=Tetrapyrgos nigripes TaxID=182062 RepID=A0A8H5H037_9AGAR|nr:hypothetical protein D9758_004533 [Tetrapyrgos nigripes]
MSFSHCSNFTINGSTINYVQGNQVIVKRIIQKPERIPTPYDDYFRIRTGALRLLKEIHCYRYPRRWDSEIRAPWEERLARADRRIYTTEVRREKGSIFTAIAYDGPEAVRAWEEDFKLFSATRTTNILQLFGINRSNVPWLIFYDELMPVSHMWNDLKVLSQNFLHLISAKLHCIPRQLWIDPREGKIVRGLDGPLYLGQEWAIDGFVPMLMTMPSQIEFLDENTVWGYICRLPLSAQLDNMVIQNLGASAIKFPSSSSYYTETEPFQPCVFFNSTSCTIATGHTIWMHAASHKGAAAHMRNFIPSAGVTDDGLTRFMLIDGKSKPDYPLYLTCSSWGNQDAWLSQAFSVLQNLDIGLDRDLSDLYVIFSEIRVDIPIKCSEIRRQRRSKVPQIYLFLHPIKRHGSRPFRHIWSFDVEGKTLISKKKCKYLGLPTSRFPIQSLGRVTMSWPAETYKMVRRWQVDRGFNPHTTDFAQFLGYPLFEVAQSTQLCEVGGLPGNEVPPIVDMEDLELDTLFYDRSVGLKTNIGESDTKHWSLWSTLSAPFSWNAVEDSEILASIF